MARRLIKVLIWFLAGVILLERAGVNVTALFAGLGLGGVAVALAARKTIENMFGGISLITREAMRVGDFCKVNGQTGTVEDIGLGTTRIRTPSRTVISFPNATLAQADLENFSMRDKFLLQQTVELRPETTQQQIESILAAIGEFLKTNPKVEPATWHVRFLGFNPTSLKLEVFAYILEPSFDAFLAAQERILLDVLASIENAGASVALRGDLPPQVAKDLEKLAESHI
jgi:MscS family membrane protein